MCGRWSILENKNHPSWPSIRHYRSRPDEQTEFPLASQILDHTGYSFDKIGNGIYGLCHARCFGATGHFDSIATDVKCYGSQMASIPKRAFRKVKPMKSEKWPFRWFIPHFAGISPATKPGEGLFCIMYILFDLWFPLPNLCFAAACIFNSGGVLWWLGRAKKVLGLTWLFLFCQNLSKKNNPGKTRKSPGTPQESPGTPVNFFWTWITQVQRSFSFFGCLSL